MTTVLSEIGTAEVAAGRADGDALWLPADALAASTGWALKPEGLCRDEICVPLPADLAQRALRNDMVDIAALWRHMGQPVVASDEGDAWVLGEGAAARSAALDSLTAPDFALTDLDGKSHRLSDHRGNKVLLATWASW